MKVIGLIGGVSWESSLEYYRLINQAVRDRLGPQRSAKLIMYSLDFAPVAQLEHDEKWSDLADYWPMSLWQSHRRAQIC